MLFNYYLKRLTKNELGYRNNKLVTGQFLYISKEASPFFPTLSQSIHNDHKYIELLVDYKDHPIFVNYIYHNDKFNRVGGTRDEFRIYLNRDFAPDDFFYKPNDIIIFKKNSENKYQFQKVNQSDKNYDYLNTLIENNHIRGSHALIETLNI
jgi:hypothetical protein